MHTNLPLRSSSSFSSSVTLSLPNSSLSPWINEYASSMNRIPPIALSIVSRVFGAVWPWYGATMSALDTSITSGLAITPREYRILPISLATVVLPVPGLPRNR